MRGKEAESLWKKLKSFKDEEEDKFFKEPIDYYNKTFKEFDRKITQIKEEITESFANMAPFSSEIDSAILSSKFGLADNVRKELVNFLKDILNNPVRVERLFRAS